MYELLFQKRILSFTFEDDEVTEQVTLPPKRVTYLLDLYFVVVMCRP